MFHKPTILLSDLASRSAPFITRPTSNLNKESVSLIMPVRIPSAGRTETLCFGAAGASVFAPFYLMMPGAEERMAKQTAYWAPRWERNITFFKSPVERGTQRVTPPVAKMVRNSVQYVDQRLHVEKNFKKLDTGIRKNMDRVGWPKRG